MATCEDEIIERAACGDQDAFQQLWIMHHAVAMAAALRLCHQRALAEEITQGAFLLLILPSAPNIIEDRAALDVLLTVGLARYLLTRKWRYRWIYLLMLFLLLADGATLVLANLYQQWMTLLITLIATVSLVPMLYWHQRRRALQADMLAVRWLGRSRMCRGLHKLADYSHVPCRCCWSEPSLAERIERVCGPRVETCDERVTMAR